MIIGCDEVVVCLIGVTPSDAYAWGCETGAFIQYDYKKMLGRHTVFAGNLMMLEMLAAERHMHIDVLGQQGAMMQIEITPVKHG